MRFIVPLRAAASLPVWLWLALMRVFGRYGEFRGIAALAAGWLMYSGPFPFIHAARKRRERRVCSGRKNDRCGVKLPPVCAHTHGVSRRCWASWNLSARR